MPWFGLFLRWLMVSLCLVPFTSPRQAASFAHAPTAPASSERSEREEEDENTREEETDVKVRTRGGHSLVGEPISIRVVSISIPRLSRIYPNAHPRAVDHFRNGLGTPFRC